MIRERLLSIIVILSALLIFILCAGMVYISLLFTGRSASRQGYHQQYKIKLNTADAERYCSGDRTLQSPRAE